MKSSTKKTTRKSTKKSFTGMRENKQDLFLIEFLKKVRLGNPLNFQSGLLRSGMMSFSSKKSYQRSNLHTLWIERMIREEEGIKTSSYWITFPGIKKEGGMLKKGSHGTPIWVPMSKKVIDEKTGEEKIKRWFSTKSVFNLADTTGIEIPDERADREVITNEEIESYLFVPVVRNHQGRFYFTEEHDHISMPPQKDLDTDENYYQTLLHELTHATGVKTRLDRSCFKDYAKSKEERANEEFVAEFGSYLMAKEFGILLTKKQEQNTLNYLASWGKHLSDEAALTSLKQSFSAVETILSKEWFKKDESASKPEAKTVAARSTK